MATDTPAETKQIMLALKLKDVLLKLLQCREDVILHGLYNHQNTTNWTKQLLRSGAGPLMQKHVGMFVGGRSVILVLVVEL